MTKPIIQIGDVQREMTDDELAQYEIDQKAMAAEKAAFRQRETTRKNAIAKLGLTDDEIAALFG